MASLKYQLSMITSLCDLQMLLLLLLFATASLLQKSKKALKESCSRIMFGPSLEKQWFVSRLVLACNGSEIDESPPGTRETGEVFGAKQLNKEKGSNQAHWDTNFSLSLSCVCLERLTYHMPSSYSCC